MNIRRLLSTLPLLLAAAATQSLHAQSEVVSVGPGYSSEVFYDMEDGIVATAPLDEWDIGFQIQGFASSIITNGGAGIRLYVVPNKTYEDFGTAIDTTGMAAGWAPWYNSATTWEMGAFNIGSDYETGNFGWGAYNMVTHTVAGTTLYIIVLPDGTAKQIIIEGLTSGSYTFSYADPDGSNKTTAALSKSNFGGKNFGYYSIRQGKEVDHEPNSENWDLVFGKYIAWVGAGNETPYVVTGVRSNAGVKIAEIETVNPAQEPAPNDDEYSDTISQIGHDWKEFAGAWSLRDVVYFVKDQEGDIYRLYFTSFGGSSTGDITLSKAKVSTSAVEGEGTTAARFGIYPNIVERGESFNLLFSVEHPIRNAQIRLFDETGREVWSHMPGTSTGLRQIPVRADLPGGAYTALLDADGMRANCRVIVR